MPIPRNVSCFLSTLAIYTRWLYNMKNIRSYALEHSFMSDISSIYLKMFRPSPINLPDIALECSPLSFRQALHQYILKCLDLHEWRLQVRIPCTHSIRSDQRNQRCTCWSKFRKIVHRTKLLLGLVIIKEQY